MFTLRQLRFLIALADELNFSRAAEICFVTQPTLSAGIQELEAQLGVTLFERTRRSVMLTEVGSQVVARARRLLVDAEDIRVLAQAHSNPFEGDLRLGVIPTIGPYLIPQTLPVIRSTFPKLRLFLREELTESLIDGLHSGRLDLILIALPFETGSLSIEPLFEDGYQLATPPGSPATPGKGSETLLTSGHLMLLEKGHCLQRHALEAYPGKISNQQDDFAATSLPTLIAMVSEGLGITLLPNLAVEAGVVAKGQVQLTDLPDACPRQIVLAWRSGSARAEVFRRLGEVLRGERPRPE
ncbi:MULTISPECIES: hydrogen peroxide-inducible genes activator [Rhodobacterales]|jgi:LysR family hydrogen peroxide-inducible transcriptional activator|uniref:hydrogen peroxide-inducible genes activator n=1 Tax=Rhodobacterales TaxID=204455 RepID=UPI00237F152B|nr:hydrogen peroxide-inducible genes activator [Phaeobacter gallaeciensis]MDE4140214.1 LysR substrate-binding domain-containing protein [Phaeobacter gallaeciensis]MDE4149093.1 LysR substrate-binding domain-containing protein [Phaeobacter gallaeciensis]MDE4153315.1 LysR substrate-binding domain-containing protein [Phaeobacter gallaeciensis]MDE4228271.1 LysR substrate-binding domain-containing protein [Phaeobacter gallaeciensis]MDE4257347.1 LysR substrate-binding domain-containing protein [Phaeo